MQLQERGVNSQYSYHAGRWTDELYTIIDGGHHEAQSCEDAGEFFRMRPNQWHARNRAMQSARLVKSNNTADFAAAMP